MARNNVERRQGEAFDLEAADWFEPLEILKSKDDQVGAFYLALAVAYNDIKGIVWFRKHLSPYEPGPHTTEESDGEFNGFGTQLNKYAVAVVHELIVLLQKKKRLVQTEEVQKYFKRLPPKQQRRWNTLFAVATTKGGLKNDKFGMGLSSIRNSMSFHYDTDKLAAGYLGHFDTASKTKSNRYAAVSLGESMERVRFYFADAAVEHGIEQLKSRTDFTRMMRRTISDLNEVLSAVVASYVYDNAQRVNSE